MINTKKLSMITRKHQDVNENEVKFTAKITAKAESTEIRVQKKSLTKPITEREDLKPLLGMDWLRDFNWTIQNIDSTTTTTDQSEEETKFSQTLKNFSRRKNN